LPEVSVIDTHAHIAMEGYDGGAQAVLQRAAQAGVQHIVCIGAGGNRDEIWSAVRTARQFAGVSAICGIHPHDGDAIEPSPDGDALWQAVVDACQQPEVVAVGETGLDFHYNLSEQAGQIASFVRHIALAKELGKPLCIHTRNAEAETLQILRDQNAKAVGGVIHCFSGTADFGVRCAEELGFYLSIPGIVTFKKPGELAQAIERTPLDRLLIETDSPFLAPIPHRGQRNEPAYIGYTLAKFAEIKGISVEQARQATTANAIRLFGERLRTSLTPVA
jgi:TatD DNase family protein